MLRRSNLYRAIAETCKRERFTISRLTNGLRVITVDEGNAVTSMGLFIKNGPRYEDERTAGSSAVFQSLPLLGNELYSGEQISTTIGALGNAFKVDNKRQSMSFVLMTPSYHRKDGLQLLNGMCLHPTQNRDIFQQAKQDTMKRAMLISRDTSNTCFQLVHEAGWDGKGLGKPTIPPVSLLSQLTLENFTKFHRHHTRPQRAVVAATGIPDHDVFVSEVEKILQFQCDEVGVSEEITPYKGGSRLVQNNTSPQSLSKFEEKDFSHVALFFRGVVMSHPDYYTISTMQSMLGGGMAFSSGGPGKGMHTKLFREVLSRAGWVNGLECITAWYSDTGLIGMYGTTQHDHTAKLVNVIIQQALRISEQVGQTDLSMAKNQLLSQIILLGEGREQLLMDMGYQLLTQNFIITPTQTMEGSAKVQMSDIRRVHRDILQSPFTYVVLGNVKNVPTEEQLRKVFVGASAKL